MCKTLISRSGGDANVTIRSIVRTLNDATQLIDQWLESHGAECDCLFCKEKLVSGGKRTCGMQLEQDLSGIRWVIENASSVIDCQSTLIDEELAELLSRLDGEVLDNPSIVE